MPKAGYWGALLGLSLVLLLTGCASWTNPAKPSTAFADDAAVCKDEAAHAALTSGQFDLIKTTPCGINGILTPVLYALVLKSQSRCSTPCGINGILTGCRGTSACIP